MRKKMQKGKSLSRRSESPDPGDAFVPDVGRGHGRLADEAEDFAEQFMATATSGEDAFEVARDEFVSEELGGPFLGVEQRELVGECFADEQEPAELSA